MRVPYSFHKGLFCLISLILFVTGGCVGFNGSQKGIQLGPEIKMDWAEFGFFYYDEEGSIFFCESQNVPIKKNTFYGWRIHLITDKEKITWKEIFILPKPPSLWGYGKGTEIEDQGEVATTEKTVTPKNGWIGHGWFVAPGDPSGTYVMKIHIEGSLAKTFTFEIK